MTTNSMTHERFETLLPAWMEGELRGDEREAFDAHAAACPECGPLVRDLEQIVARAATLGPIEPPRDLWNGIDARIGAPVVPLASRRRAIPFARNLAAAAVLVAATAGITWKLARQGAVQRVAPASAVAAAATIPSTTRESTSTAQRVADAGASSPQYAASTTAERQTEDRGTSRAARTAGVGAQLVANPRARVPGESDVYDREITRLRTVLRQRRSDLDPRTVMAIEKSLAVIDTAIAQARSALAADPASRFLNDRLTNALDKKVELLRTAALLPARS